MGEGRGGTGPARRFLLAARKRPAVLAAAGVGALLLAVAAAVAVIVSLPPRSSSSPASASPEREDLVRQWPLPPGDPLAPKLAWEREGIGAYSSADAARLALEGAPDARMLAERSDEAVAKLYGAAR